MTDGSGLGHTGADVDPRYWERVLLADCAVPADRGLDDLTVELVELLGAADPRLRDDLALRVLRTWIGNGVYDDLLPALGDGLTEGLRPGLGEDGSLSVLRRSFSAAALVAVLDRENTRRSLHPDMVLGWGDRALSWLLAERDLRSHVAGAGRAQALVHGADLVRALALSRHLPDEALMLVLDSVVERVLLPTVHAFTGREEDHLAYATMVVLHRGVPEDAVLGSWVGRLAAGWAGRSEHGEPVPAQMLNTLAYARALHLALLLGVRVPDAAARVEWFAGPPVLRVELLAALQGALRTSAPHFRPAPVP